MKKILFTLLSFGVLACNQPANDSAAVEAPATETAEILTFGEGIAIADEMPVDEFLTQLTAADSLENVLISGTINSCCQKKGCWMKVDLGNDREMMVKFKDYGFFMPLDCSGSTVRLQGRAFKETVSVDELRHYAEDAGKTPDEIAAITEPETRFSFEASGVELIGYTPSATTDTPTEESGHDHSSEEEISEEVEG
jgi:hypothetical protein